MIFSDVYSLAGVLGAGQFGIVLAVRPKTISPYHTPEEQKDMSALKIIYKGKLCQEEIRVIRSEANILEQLEGKQFVVQLKNFYETQSYILIEMEYLGGG